MNYQEAIEILKNFDSQVSAKTDGAYQTTIGKMACDIAISAMQELKLYKDSKLCLIPESVYSKQCTELDAYKQLGTLGEIKNAVEKQIPKKPKTKILCRDIKWWCPNCGENHVLMYAKKGFKYCHNCGQKLDWSEEE